MRLETATRGPRGIPTQFDEEETRGDEITIRKAEGHDYRERQGHRVPCYLNRKNTSTVIVRFHLR
jgi:hypothetical protein